MSAIRDSAIRNRAAYDALQSVGWFDRLKPNSIVVMDDGEVGLIAMNYRGADPNRRPKGIGRRYAREHLGSHVMVLDARPEGQPAAYFVN